MCGKTLMSLKKKKKPPVHFNKLIIRLCCFTAL